MTRPSVLLLVSLLLVGCPGEPVRPTPAPAVSPGPTPAPPKAPAGPAPREERTGPELPIRVEFEQPRYELTLAQAAAGVKLRAKVVVEREVEGVIPTSFCSAPTPGATGSFPFADLEGGKQYFGLVDVGLGPSHRERRSLLAGTDELTLDWKGRNWTGPSDYGAKPGEAFPPGEYRFRVRVAGSVQRDGKDVPYSVTASVPVTLVP